MLEARNLETEILGESLLATGMVNQNGLTIFLKKWKRPFFFGGAGVSDDGLVLEGAASAWF